MAVTRALGAVQIKFEDGLSFDLLRMGGMDTRPAPDASWPPTTFVYTGEHEIECVVRMEQHNAAWAILKGGRVPCTLWLKPDAAAVLVSFIAQSFSVGTDFSTLSGFIYQGAYNGKPVTDPSMVAYLIEQYAIKPLTPEERAEADMWEAMENDE